ncbi:MAG: YggS family pyridoxal phosphate-dependent enzyme [Gemmatimonadota bacterium]
MYDRRLSQSLPRVEERIAAARNRAGRADAVRLIAVTKGHPVEAVAAAVRAGLRDVGENRVQELEEKRAAFDAAGAGDAAGAAGPEWHLIGHLQRNKVRRAITLFEMIHSVDSLRLAQELSKEAERAGIVVRALVQVNVSGEVTKGGFEAARAVDMIAGVASLPGIAVEGLMTMAPFTDDEAMVRSTFAGARGLLERCAAEGVPVGRELSMGMSGDYEIAIEEGSTMVRIGTTLFGEREP